MSERAYTEWLKCSENFMCKVHRTIYSKARILGSSGHKVVKLPIGLKEEREAIQYTNKPVSAENHHEKF